MAYKATVATNEYIRAAGVAMAVTSNYTIMGWFYINTTSQQGAFVVIGNDQNVTADGYMLAVGTNSASVLGNEALFGTIGVAWLDSNTSFGTGWHHWCVVDRAGSQFTYLDGINVGSFASVPNVPLNYTWIGNTGDPTLGESLTANNRVSLVKAWSSALGTAQIQVEMNSGFPVFNYDTLKLFWPLEKSGGALSVDNGIDFTQKFSITGTSFNNPSFDDNPPVARC